MLLVGGLKKADLRVDRKVDIYTTISRIYVFKENRLFASAVSCNGGGFFLSCLCVLQAQVPNPGRISRYCEYRQVGEAFFGAIDWLQ